MNILVLCTGNSARSILLESILNQDSGGRVRAYSAGSTPSGRVHPQSMTLLSELGYPTDGLAAAETCPLWPRTGPNPPLQVHWGIPDPAAAAEPDWQDAFQTAYDTLANKAKALMDIPFETMEPTELKTALTKIASV